MIDFVPQLGLGAKIMILDIFVDGTKPLKNDLQFFKRSVTSLIKEYLKYLYLHSYRFCRYSIHIWGQFQYA